MIISERDQGRVRNGRGSFCISVMVLEEGNLREGKKEEQRGKN